MCRWKLRVSLPDGLSAFGWDAQWAQLWGDRLGLVPARVVLEHGRFLRVHDGVAESLAIARGKLRHQADSGADMPTVGDWVALAPGAGGDGPGGEKLGSIQAVLPRRGRFSRRRAGVRAVEQVVAANVDVVFLIMGLDLDFNPRRLERYLTVAFASGARPVVVMNKADLAVDVEVRRAEVATICAGAPGGVGVPILTTNLRQEGGHEAVMPFMTAGATIALLGSSGVGKSTLLNRLLGGDVQRTAGVREHDSRGRHTTTFAQLFRLPGGALAIDTPGMRELQLWEADEGVDATFSDIEELAAACRFRDCRHRDEPACAVRAALEEGRLDRARFASWGKLDRELADTRGQRGPGKGRGGPPRRR